MRVAPKSAMVVSTVDGATIVSRSPAASATVVPVVANVEALSERWKEEIRQIHFNIERGLGDRFDTLRAETQVGLLLERMDRMEKVLAENAAVHRQQQADMIQVVQGLRRSMWLMFTPGMRPSDAVLDSFIEAVDVLGGSVSKLDKEHLRAILGNAARDLNTLDAEVQWHG